MPGKKHPNPLLCKPIAPEDREIIGWFLIGFREDPDHEYSFVVKRDGTILPELDLVDLEPTNEAMFYQYLSDPNIHHVRFVQSLFLGDTTGRDVKYDPWKQSFPI